MPLSKIWSHLRLSKPTLLTPPPQRRCRATLVRTEAPCKLELGHSAGADCRLRTSMRRHCLSRPTWRPPFVVERYGPVSLAERVDQVRFAQSPLARSEAIGHTEKSCVSL